MTHVRSIKQAFIHMFDKDFELLMNNPSEVKEIDLEEFVFQEELKDFDLISVF